MAVQETVQQDSYTDTVGRMRALEGKYNLLRDRMLIINNNMIEQYKKNITETRTINEDIKEIKIDLFKIKETIKHLVEEFELFARKEDVKFLEKYINLWNPVKFVTTEEMNKAIESHHTKKEETKKVKDGSK